MTNMAMGEKTSREFKLVCVIGPMSSREFANRFADRWAESRGLQPRVVVGSLIAKHLKLPMYVDFYQVLGLQKQRGERLRIVSRNDDEIVVEVIKSEKTNKSTKLI